MNTLPPRPPKLGPDAFDAARSLRLVSILVRDAERMLDEATEHLVRMASTSTDPDTREAALRVCVLREFTSLFALKEKPDEP